MLATCICLNGSLLDQLSCTIVNLFTCTFGRINMSVCLSVCLSLLPGESCNLFNVGFSPDVLYCGNNGQLSSFFMWFLLVLAHIIILVSVLRSFRNSYFLTAHHSDHCAIAGLIWFWRSYFDRDLLITQCPWHLISLHLAQPTFCLHYVVHTSLWSSFCRNHTITPQILENRYCCYCSVS